MFTQLAYTDILLIPRPTEGRRLSWPGWLTYSGRLTHEVVTRQPWIRRRSGKVRRLQTDVLTKFIVKQFNYYCTCCASRHSRVGYANINNQGSKNITQVVTSVTGTGSIVCIDSKLRTTYNCYLNTR